MIKINNRFKKVETEADFGKFKEIWFEVCEEKNFESDPFKEKGERYLIWDEKTNTYIGTIEITPYHEKTSSMEYYLDFHAIPEIKQNSGRVYEIDKVCLRKEYRNKMAMIQFIFVFIQHILSYRPKYYISVTESNFHEMLEKVFDITVLEKDMEFDGFSLVASLMDVEENVQKGKLDKWLRKMKRVPLQ